MKTRELIRLLQEEDPSGELECCIGGEDVHFVAGEPGYYDGCHTVLKRDPTIEYYNVTGVEIRANDRKLKLHSLGWKSALTNNPETPVEYDSDYARDYYAEKVEAWREEVRGWSRRRPARKIVSPAVSTNTKEKGSTG